MEKLYQPEDEVEAAALEAALGEAGIRFVMRQSRSTTSLGLADQSGVWGQILVHPEDLEEAQNLVADWLESEVVDESTLGPYRAPAPEPRRGAQEKQSTPRTDLLPWALLVLAVGGNLLQWVAYRDVQPATTLIDAEGRRVAAFHYEDGDEFPSRTTGFDKGGAVVSRCYDRNDDAWYEECDTLLPEDGGRLHDVDEDGDGRFELSILYDAGNTERMRWIDADRDGHYERVERTGGAFGDDTNGDGIIDRWTCESGRRVDVDHCRVLEPTAE